MDEAPRTWFIEVCRECGRLAQWPFCEHRQKWLDEYTWTGGPVQKPRPSWCETVMVREVGRRRARGGGNVETTCEGELP